VAQLVAKKAVTLVGVVVVKLFPVTYELLKPAKPEVGFAQVVRFCPWAADWREARLAARSVAPKTPLTEKNLHTFI
jgi:hypothetical protein